jgi:hypothetical protein
MSASELEIQPVQVLEVDEAREELSDAPYPTEKSSIELNKNAILQGAKFKEGTVVHMSQIANGAMVKGVFTVSKPKANPAGYPEYQLTDALTGKLHNNGVWVRESKLKKN